MIEQVLETEPEIYICLVCKTVEVPAKAGICLDCAVKLMSGE